MRRILALALAGLLTSPALAQYGATGSSGQSNVALIAPTAPPSDNSDRVANTAFVTQAVAAASSTIVLASGKIFIGSVGNVATPQTPTGDCAFSVLGVVICTKTNGVLFAPSATTDTTTQANVAFTGLSAAAAAADADTFPVNQGAANLKQTFAAVKTWIKSWIAKADVGLGNVPNVDTTNASNISSGTLAAARVGQVNLAASGNGGVGGNLPVGNLNSGTGASSTTAWFGDGSWKTPAGGGNVTGPAGAVADNVSSYNGATGTIIKDSGVPVAALPTAVGQMPGVATNSNASAGNVGEFVSSTVLTGSAVSLTTSTAANVTSISLTAGDWLVYGNVAFNSGGTTSSTVNVGWISTTSATLPTVPNNGAYGGRNGPAVVGDFSTYPVGQTRLSLSATTTVYLSAFSTFTVSTNAVYGFIGARRVR